MCDIPYGFLFKTEILGTLVLKFVKLSVCAAWGFAGLVTGSDAGALLDVVDKTIKLDVAGD